MALTANERGLVLLRVPLSWTGRAVRASAKWVPSREFRAAGFSEHLQILPALDWSKGRAVGQATTKKPGEPGAMAAKLSGSLDAGSPEHTHPNISQTEDFVHVIETTPHH